MMVLGTPGSGKTTVIVGRINNLIYKYGVKPENILVITFTRAAAASMRDRFLESSGMDNTAVRFGTFHSFFYWILRTAYGGRVRLEVLDEAAKRNKIREILVGINRELYDNEEIISSIINQLGIMACNMIDIDNYYSRDIAQNDFRSVYSRYNAYKLESGLIDFDDMVTQCYILLKKREDILARLRDMYPFIMVDEYQDTNKIQYEILKMLAHPRDNIYVVGDDDQSIYGFRGARPEIMQEFKTEFHNAEVMQLSYNFRCPEIIINRSSDIISGNRKRYDKQLLAATDKKGEYHILRVNNVDLENSLIIKNIIEGIHSGQAPNEIAVLYRTNTGPRKLINSLRTYNIPFNLRDYIPDISTSPYVRPIINYIRYASGDHRRDIFLSIMNKPVRYISRNSLKKSVVEIDDLLDACKEDYLIRNLRRMKSELRTISKLPPFAAVNYIRRAVGYDEYLLKLADDRNIDYDDVVDILDEFQEMIHDAGNVSEMLDIIEDSRRIVEQDSHDNPDAVQLMTLHSAKGLEFSDVHILDVVEGIIPHRRSKTPDEIEEERRLLYVGVTRSSNRLYIYVPKEMKEREVKISRFIDTQD